ncbi:P-loop NTPase [Salinibaculum salinum]|uniref:P-loop NTPase n=1 Tax=Salinibaculum salinum TaxID=3131996 RepID=UPI0030EB2446
MKSDGILTIAGAKGGVGKTTTSINLGSALAADGYRVVVVELDLAMANVVDFLSLPRSEDDPTLHEVLAGEADIEDAVYQLSANFAVAPSGTDLEGYTAIDFERLSGILDDLSDAFDIVIVDTGAGLSRATIEPIRLADATVLVSTPRVAAIRDVDKTKKISERVETPVCGLVLTKSGTGASPGPGRIADFLDVTLLGHVPEDEAVPSSQDSGEPVVEADQNSEAATQYRRVASNLLSSLGVETSEADDRSHSTQSTTSLSEDTSQASAETTVSEWMSVSVDGNEAVATSNPGDSKKTALSDGQGPSRYEPSQVDSEAATGPSASHRAVETQTDDSADDESAGIAGSNTPATDAGQSTRNQAITHVPDGVEAAETERRTEDGSGGEPSSESRSTAGESNARSEARSAAPEQRATGAETDSDDETNSDTETEDDSTGSSLTARLRSFVDRF